MDPSVSPFEDSLKSDSIQVIPPDGTVMVDFNKRTPVKVTIDVGPNDSVSAKLKQITSIASDYANTPNKLAQDLIKSQNMSVDYCTDGESIAVTQISASLSSTNYEGAHLFKSKKTSAFEMHTAAAAAPNNFEDDLLGQSDDPEGTDEYMDKDTEDKLLRNESPTQDMDNKSNTLNQKCKKMASEDEDSSNTKSAPMKKKTRTLGVCHKKTSGAVNYGKSAKLPAFSSLSKSILQKKIQSNDQSSSSYTSPSDDKHDDTTDDNTNSETYISISDEHLTDAEAKVKPKSKTTRKTKEESAFEENRKKIRPKEITRIEYHPLTNKKLGPIEDDPFFSGSYL